MDIFIHRSTHIDSNKNRSIKLYTNRKKSSTNKNAFRYVFSSPRITLQLESLGKNVDEKGQRTNWILLYFSSTPCVFGTGEMIYQTIIHLNWDGKRDGSQIGAEVGSINFISQLKIPFWDSFEARQKIGSATEVLLTRRPRKKARKKFVFVVKMRADLKIEKVCSCCFAHVPWEDLYS